MTSVAYRRVELAARLERLCEGVHCIVLCRQPSYDTDTSAWIALAGRQQYHEGGAEEVLF